MRLNTIGALFVLMFSSVVLAQEPTATASPTAASAATTPNEEAEKPSAARIRRVVNLIVGVEHDEELLIPDKELIFRGKTNLIDMKRIKGTDFFRITPKSVGNGIVTIHNKKTGQVLVELRFDIRNDAIEKTLREVKSLLGDIEGVEYKIVNDQILLDGFAIIPRDLVRIAQVIKTFGTDKVRSLVTLSPIARKKIAEYISRDVNNPEVSVTAVGDYIKLEGVVNSEAEKNRIIQIVGLYMPDIVVEIAPDTEHIKIVGRKSAGKIEEMIINLITVKKDEEKVEPPPKMIQIVAHFVEYSERYIKNFQFVFSPKFSTVDSAARQPNAGSLTEIFQLVNNLLPKLTWAKKHGYARVLDTGSILVQDKSPASLTRSISIFKEYVAGAYGAQNAVYLTAKMNISTTPTIKSERSGLVELKSLNVQLQDPNTEGGSADTAVQTTISVRDRQSAAFGGTIKKKKDADFGGPVEIDAIFNLNQGKKYNKNSSNFVVFVTPIIKASASSGVDQVKKKFRLRD